MKLAAVLSFSLALISSAFAKPPITEGETDPVLLDFESYMIEALSGCATGGSEPD